MKNPNVWWDSLNVRTIAAVKKKGVAWLTITTRHPCLVASGVLLIHAVVVFVLIPCVEVHWLLRNIAGMLMFWRFCHKVPLFTALNVFCRQRGVVCSRDSIRSLHCHFLNKIFSLQSLRQSSCAEKSNSTSFMETCKHFLAAVFVSPMSHLPLDSSATAHGESGPHLHRALSLNSTPPQGCEPAHPPIQAALSTLSPSNKSFHPLMLYKT